MKKIAIVTIVGINFGNKLQNYALQKVLEDFGCTVQTLRRNQSKKGFIYRLKTAVQITLQTKGAKFRQFDKNIHFSDFVVERDNYPFDLNQQYDFFVAGSDQIWNPYFDFAAGKCDFLVFARNEQKISYAASFGVSEIPTEKKAEIQEALKTFNALSVREQQGAYIIKNLTGREASVVLDPTLLLSQEEWKSVEKKSKLTPKTKYVLVYALGEKSNRFETKIKDFIEETKYQIFDLRLKQKNGKEPPVGPAEFIYLIRNAEAVLTDSFHATVFSIIFHKRFITFDRSGLNMSSRIASLAKLLELNKYLNQYGDFECLVNIDYDHVDKILEVERKKSVSFLYEAIQ